MKGGGGGVFMMTVERAPSPTRHRHEMMMPVKLHVNTREDLAGTEEVYMYICIHVYMYTCIYIYYVYIPTYLVARGDLVLAPRGLTCCILLAGNTNMDSRGYI